MFGCSFPGVYVQLLFRSVLLFIAPVILIQCGNDSAVSLTENKLSVKEYEPKVTRSSPKEESAGRRETPKELSPFVAPEIPKYTAREEDREGHLSIQAEDKSFHDRIALASEEITSCAVYRDARYSAQLLQLHLQTEGAHRNFGFRMHLYFDPSKEAFVGGVPTRIGARNGSDVYSYSHAELNLRNSGWVPLSHRTAFRAEASLGSLPASECRLTSRISDTAANLSSDLICDNLRASDMERGPIRVNLHARIRCRINRIQTFPWDRTFSK